MSISRRSIWTWVVGIGLVLVGCLSLFLSVLTYGIVYRQWNQPAVVTVARVLHFPIGHMGSHWFTYASFLDQLNAEQKYLASNPGATTATDLDVKKLIIQKMLNDAAVEAVADDQKIVVTPVDVDHVYAEIIQSTGTSTTPAEFRSFLQDTFGWGEEAYKEYFVRPETVHREIRQKMEPNATSTTTGATDQAMQDRLAEKDVRVYLRLR
jgi:hypothetical protein